MQTTSNFNTNNNTTNNNNNSNNSNLNNSKSTPTKVINISPKPNKNNNNNNNNKQNKKLPFFNIVEPILNKNNNKQIHNNNNHHHVDIKTGITPKKTPITITATTTTTNKTTILLEKDDNIFDDIHDSSSDSDNDDDEIGVLNHHNDDNDDSNYNNTDNNICNVIDDVIVFGGIKNNTLIITSNITTPTNNSDNESEESSGSNSESEETTGISSSESSLDLVALSSSHTCIETIKISNNIKLHDFNITHLVGKGGFGKVHQVVHKHTGKVYALKTIKKNHIIQRKSVLNTLAEKDILKRIEHPFIVKLHYAFQNEKKLYLVMDFINGGQLFYHLQKEKIFSESQVRFYIAELILAIEHLHELNIIHRDLKPENILLDNQGHCVLTDFGLAKEEITDEQISGGSICGTFEYMSPEMIQGKSYGKPVDWWSIGILMFDMLCGKPPFETKNRAVAQEKIIKEKQKYPNYISSAARSLINGLLHKDPKLRLGSNGGAREIKKHAFFKQIQWRKLELKEIQAPFVPKTSDISDISNFDTDFLKEPIRDSFSASPSLSTSQQAFFDGFSFVRTPILNLNLNN